VRAEARAGIAGSKIVRASQPSTGELTLTTFSPGEKGLLAMLAG